MIPAGASQNKASLEEDLCRGEGAVLVADLNVISMMGTKLSVQIQQPQISVAGGLLILTPIVKSIGMLTVGNTLPLPEDVMLLMAAGGILLQAGVEI